MAGMMGIPLHRPCMAHNTAGIKSGASPISTRPMQVVVPKVWQMTLSVLNRAAAVALATLAIAGCALQLPAIARTTNTDGGMPIAAIRRLPAHELDARPAVRVRGIVTQRQARTLIVQDDTGGIFVNFEFASEEGVWRGEPNGPVEVQVGMAIELDGFVDPGGFSPALMPSAVRVLGPAALPEPRTTDFANFFSGADDCERIEIEALVRAVQPDAAADRRDRTEGDEYVALSLAHDGRPFEVRIVSSASPIPPESLINATVRVTGPPVALFNTRGEFLMPLIWIDQPEGLALVAKPQTPPFEAPFIPLERLGKFRTDPLWNHVIRTEGTVTHAAAGSYVYLQSGAIGVRVATRTEAAIRPGDRIEAAGFLDRSGRVCGVADAQVRILRHGVPPAPLDITPDEIATANVSASDRNLMAKPGDFEGCLVRFSARVIGVQTTPEGAIVVMTSGQSSVIARLPEADMRAVGELEPTAEVRVTGIAQLGWQNEWANGRSARPLARPTQMTILLRSFDDIEVTRPAPFWTSRRLSVATAVTAAVLMGSLAWVALLRRQVALQLDVIEDKLRCETVAGERRRIAREFHDTLEQSLAGVAMRLDAACRRLGDDESRVVLREQRQLIGRLQSDAREFLWDLRDSLGEGSDLATAIAAQTAVLAPLSETSVQLDVEASELHLKTEFQHDVIRIVREAVLNAFRHAEAKNVRIVVAKSITGKNGGPRTEVITLTIEDDGCGFDVADRCEVPGHYGIRGMTERAERVGAQLTITSRRGHGTKVRLMLPLASDGAGRKRT